MTNGGAVTGRRTRNFAVSAKEDKPSKLQSSAEFVVRRSSRRSAIMANKVEQHSILNEVCGPETQRLHDLSMDDAEYLPSHEELKVTC